MTHGVRVTKSSAQNAANGTNAPPLTQWPAKGVQSNGVQAYTARHNSRAWPWCGMAGKVICCKQGKQEMPHTKAVGQAVCTHNAPTGQKEYIVIREHRTSAYQPPVRKSTPATPGLRN